MQTYRLYLVGEADGVVYGIKEYEAETDAGAAEVAATLLPQENDWDGQRLVKQFSADSKRSVAWQ